MYKQFALYLYLKYITNGIIRLRLLPVKSICKALGIGEKHYGNCLRYLIKLNWLGYDEKTDILFIRGFDEVKRQIKGRGKHGAFFKIEYLKDIKFYTFSVAAALIIKRNKKFNSRNRKSRMKRAERKSDRSLQLFTCYDLAPIYSMHPNMVPTQYFATFLGMSLSTIHLLKKGAARLGYIKIRHNKYVMDRNGKDFVLFKRTYPELKGVYCSDRGEIILNGCDSIECGFFLLKRN